MELACEVTRLAVWIWSKWSPTGWWLVVGVLGIFFAFARAIPSSEISYCEMKPPKPNASSVQQLPSPVLAPVDRSAVKLIIATAKKLEDSLAGRGISSWEKLSTVRGCERWIRFEGCKFNSMGRMFIPHSRDSVLSFALSAAGRKSDPLIECESIVDLDPSPLAASVPGARRLTAARTRTVTHAPLPGVRAREAIGIRGAWVDVNGRGLVVSVPDSGEVGQGRVRAQVALGVAVVPVEGGCLVTVVQCVNPGPGAPRLFLGRFAARRCLSPLWVAEAMEKTRLSLPAPAPLETAEAAASISSELVARILDGYRRVGSDISGEGWELHGVRSGCTQYLQREGSMMNSKGVGAVQQLRDKIVDFVTSEQGRRLTDDMFASERVVEQLPRADVQRALVGAEVQRVQIVHTITKSPVPGVAPRDAVTCQVVYLEPALRNRAVVLMVPWEHPQAPITSGRVRSIVSGVAVVTPVGDARTPACELTAIQRVDPGGVVPHWAVNTFAPKRCLLPLLVQQEMSKLDRRRPH